ncbi:GNAT family N-acetyltransferase [Oerskovia sp. M15]
MTEPLLPDSLALAIGCHHDGPRLADLARRRLPTMPHLHDEELWRTTYRFGPGFHPRDRYFPVLREQGDGSDGRDDRVVAFAWVDAALDEQGGVSEPWWCLNAIAVSDERSGAGLGSYLVRKIVEQARAAGSRRSTARRRPRPRVSGTGSDSVSEASTRCSRRTGS